MPVYAGAGSQFNYILENYLGAPLPETPAFKTLIADDIEPGIDPSLIKVRGCGSRDLVALKRGLLKADLKVIYPLPSDDIMNFVHHVVDCYAMTVSVLDEGPDELIDLLYTGSRIDKATISCAIEDVLKAECELMSQDVTGASAKPEGATYTPLSGAVSWEDVAVLKGDADGSNLSPFEVTTDWKFTIANNLKRVGVIRASNPTKPKYIIPLHRDLSGELTCTFESKDQYYAAAAGAFSLKFDLSAGKYFLFKNCQWEKVNSVRKPDDIVSMKLAFTASSFVDSEEA
ncbi:MAG: phage tail tube protein [Candidatus Bathyarchaeota archaeon]|nr:phage tail tube protein [Candidatus Bathyarchaeota archaeon]